jgi:hypothetical protein
MGILHSRPAVIILQKFHNRPPFPLFRVCQKGRTCEHKDRDGDAFFRRKSDNRNHPLLAFCSRGWFAA